MDEFSYLQLLNDETLFWAIFGDFKMDVIKW